MISIIICSRKKSIPTQLVQNINRTIGIKSELIIIDNSENIYSIFEAYNKGILESKGDYLCFIHDDVIFHTENWGTIINKVFESDSKIGLIGVAGSRVKSKMPSAWWECCQEDLQINIIQHFPDRNEEHWQKGSIENVVNVAIIDGVFMVARKTNGIYFSKKLKGFHNYDMNLSFEYLKRGFKIVVTNDILIEHYSLGTLNKSWYISTLNLHKIYNKMLPLNLSNSDLKEIEFKNGTKFITELLHLKMKKDAFFLWLKLINHKTKSRFHYQFLKQFFK